MIKCPNCGSTSQITCMWHSKDFYHNISAEYECGCGCCFEVVFTPSTPKILDDDED